MQLHALAIENYRNLKQVLVEPNPRFNILAGDNGQGKSNLLEAIFLLCTLRSFRTIRSEEQVRFGERAARVRARVRRKETDHLLELELALGPPVRKQAQVDGKAARTGDYFGRVNAVLFVPADVNLPGGAPAERRRFLDRAIWNTNPVYLAEAQTYERILRSRNAVLRDDRKGSTERGTDDLLAVYDQQLAQAGAIVIRRRLSYLAELAEEVTTAFERVSKSGLVAALRYKTGAGAALESNDATRDAAHLYEGLQRDRRRDLLKGYTHSGPHTDDLLFDLGGRNASLHASQGQLRALVLAVKIAEISHLHRVLGDPPILLLDDVSSELDETRNAQLFEFLREVSAQTFITTTSTAYIKLDGGSPERTDFSVSGGEIDAIGDGVLH